VGADSIDFVLPARAENVQVVRHALGGLGEVLGMEGQAVADLKTAVTEACMNVVIHAYDGVSPGPLEVRAWRDGRRLAVRVRDFGRGIRPRVDPDRPSLRLGLPLIAALSESFELAATPSGGTEVTMRIPFSPSPDRPPLAEAPPTAEETAIEMPAGALIAPILSRVISMFAVRADFSLDKLSDAMLLGDAISINEPSDFFRGKARIAISESEQGFEVRIGPFVDQAGGRLVEGMRIEEYGVSLERLADEVRVEVEDGAEYVTLRFSNLEGSALGSGGGEDL
jgi:anti-sigma regulatory factor (Ser/Thr protein kinase)